MKSATLKKSGLTSEKNQYFYDGQRVRGVSHIIKTVGLAKDMSRVDPFYTDRGKAVHRCIELNLKGTLEESSIDPVCVPFYSQFKKWWESNGGKFISEQAYYSTQYDVVGVIDLITNKVWDIKCSKNPDPVAEIQGAFYRQIYLENTGLDLPFSVLQLDGSDGPAIEIPYEAGPELVDAVMTLYRKWKRK